MRGRSVPRGALAVDVVLYLTFAAFAGACAVWSPVSGYRLWGACAVIFYALGAVQSATLAVARPATAAGPVGRLLRSRATPVVLVALFGMLVPLVVLVRRRAQGVPWSEQPEVWVIERSATLLLHHGSPYINLAGLGRPPVADDYTPYGPAMTVFGLPRAWWGASPLTDARVAFAVASVSVVLLALAVLGWPRVSVRAAQLVVACPLTALTWSVAGDDLPVAALLILAVALAHRRAPALCGGVLAVAVSMKLIAAPAVFVVGVMLFAGIGGRALLRFALAAVGVGALLTVPVMLVDPANFVEHVVRFPLGLGSARSPAASPLPGYLIAQLGAGGHAVALGLLAVTAVATVWWLLRRPPRHAADAALRTAVCAFAAIIVAPASRFGYLLYPVVLLGATIALRAVDAASPTTPVAPDRAATAPTVGIAAD